MPGTVLGLGNLVINKREVPALDKHSLVGFARHKPIASMYGYINMNTKHGTVSGQKVWSTVADHSRDTCLAGEGSF